LLVIEAFRGWTVTTAIVVRKRDPE
jgi:hypothetical protein